MSTFNLIKKSKLILRKLILKAKYKNEKKIKKKFLKKKFFFLYRDNLNLNFFKSKIKNLDTTRKNLLMKCFTKYRNHKYKIELKCRLNFHLNSVQKQTLQRRKLRKLNNRYKKVFNLILTNKKHSIFIKIKKISKKIFYEFKKNFYKKPQLDFTPKTPYSSLLNFNTSLTIYKNQNISIFNDFFLNSYYLCQFKQLLNFQIKLYLYIFFYFVFFRVNLLVQDYDTFSSNFGRLYSSERGLFPGVPEYYRSKIRKYKFLCEKTFNRIIVLFVNVFIDCVVW